MHTFPVAEVEACREALPSSPHLDQMAAGMHAGIVARGENLRVALPLPTNPVVGAIDLAYQDHRPLSLSPDDIWITVAQGFAAHVVEHAEALRGRFVRHAGKNTIRIRRDELLGDRATEGWAACIGDFSDGIAREIGKQRDLVVCDFSTTGPVERIASEVVLMGAMREYFDYRAMSLCGIPTITLLGTPDDWLAIRRRAEVLVEYELAFWIRPLLKVLDEFVRASAGNPDREFWQSFYKADDRSGGPFVSGWVQRLFPYLNQAFVEQAAAPGLSPTIGHRVVRNPFLDDAPSAEGRQRGPTLNEFPQGITSVPFVWERLGDEIPMELLGGFVGVGQDPATRAVRPAIGWAVRGRGQ